MNQPTERRLRLLAHNVRSLWNVGAFFRTADAFGVEKIYLTGYTGTPPRKEISKTALGADEWVPWEGNRDSAPFLEELKKEGFSIVALEQTPDAVAIEQFDPPERLCLVVGHEREGIADDLLTQCDAVIHIPMLGKKESLNVSVAAGVALHALRTAL